MKLSLIQRKRGDIFQMTALVILLFIVAIVGLLFLTFSNKVTQVYEETGLLNNTVIGQQANDMIQTAGPKTTDYMIFFLFLGSVIALLISASRTRFSATVFFLFVLLLIITIFISSGMVNIYSGFANSEALLETSSQLTLTGFLFSKYTPLILTAIGGLIMLIMWGKQGSDIAI